MRAFSLLALSLAACTYIGEQAYRDEIRDFDGDGVEGTRFGGEDCRDDDPTVQRCDADGDGAIALAAGGDDCDDSDPTVFPGRLYYADDDGDGYGDLADPAEGCLAPANHVDNADDCDDANPNIHPGIQENCDPVDRNCDGDAYAGADASQWFYDRDNDGFGKDIGEEAACSPPVGQVANGDDCDDDDPAAYPGAPEIWYDGVGQDCDESRSDWDQDGDGQDVLGAPTGSATDCDDLDDQVGLGEVEACDGIDNDCDLLIDDEEPDVEQTGQLTWYQDGDRDGAGDPAVVGYFCPASSPDGWSLDDGDCRDDLSTVRPGALEVCNNRDDDCNGLIDDAAIDRATIYEDADGDGFGGLALLSCQVLAGQAAVGGDCDDADPASYPGAPEVCGDAERQDCSAFSPYDCDSDGSDGTEWLGTDCDDANPDVYLGATETCDGLDNDCDSLLDGDDPDVDPQSFPDWYLDLDADEFGVNVLVAASTCTPPAFTASNTLDCDDTRALVNPAAGEACNGRDDDCDGSVDEEASADVVTWYYDGDGDGAGDPLVFLFDQCIPPIDEPWVDLGGDCDDLDPTRGPLAAEGCDGVDNDCDALIDDLDPDIAANAPIWYGDADGDGFGLDSVVLARCAQPPDYSTVFGDCNDFDGAVNPGAPELCNAGIDDDCDGASDDADPDIGGSATWYGDGDGDGYGDAADVALQCQQPAGYVVNSGDCDDLDPSVSPAALEVCDAGTDDDCNGLADDEDLFALGDTLWYIDADHDGIGDGVPLFSCSAPPDGVASTGDCDDQDPAIFPFSTEVCNGIDDDCDTLADDADPSSVGIAWFRDGDGDGVGGPELDLACDRSADGYVLTAGDCNDGNPGIFPGAVEICDRLDQDCNAAVDDAAIDMSDFLVDGDGDGFGIGAPIAACDALPGTVADPGSPALQDCDDALAVVWPGNPVETCDGLDNDCDELIDAADLDTATSGASAWVDGDGDGFGGGDPQICTQPYSAPGLVAFPGDCDDADAGVHPLVAEVCNGIDDDCDLLVDDADAAFEQGLAWYRDDDGDGFGQFLDAAVTCWAAPAVGSWASIAGDCDDTEPLAFPGGPTDCAGGGSSAACVDRLWFLDADADGHGDPAVTLTACAAPLGYVDDAFDCDDASFGDVMPTLVLDAAGLDAALNGGGCPLVTLAVGFDDLVALVLAPGATGGVVSEDPAQPAILRQTNSEPVFLIEKAGSLSIADLSLVGAGGGEMLVVAAPLGRLTAVNVAVDGALQSQGLLVTSGHAVVSRLAVSHTVAGANEGSAVEIAGAGALFAHAVSVFGAEGVSALVLRPDGDDVAVEGLVVVASDRVRILGGTGAISLTDVQIYGARGDAMVIDGAAATVALDRAVIAQSAGDGLQTNSGATQASHVTIAASAGDGVDAAGLDLTDAIVLDSAGFDLQGRGGGMTWDHVLFGTSSGQVIGVAPVVGDPAWVSYDPAEPWEMLDFHLRPESAAYGAGSTGDHLGFAVLAEAWDADVDGNGLPDGWERRWFGGIGAVTTEDPDLDAVRTLEEFARGTAPVRTDTDGDAAPDGADFAPLDPTVQ